jgi:hypothetical protein
MSSAHAVEPVRARGQVKSPAALRGQVSPSLQAFLAKAFEQIEQAGADEDSLWAASDAGEQMEMVGRLVAGRANLELINRLGDQKVSEELRSRGKKRSTFYEQVEIFKAYNAIPSAEQIAALAAVGYTKSRLIASWTKEERLALVAGKEVRGITIHEAASLSTREFAQATRDPDLVKASKKIQALAADKEGLEAEVKELKGALKHRYETLKMPDFAAHARQEAVALSEQMTLSVTALEDLVEDRLVNDKDAKAYPEWAQRAAGTLYHSVRAVQARTQELLQRLEKQYGKAVTGKIDFEHALSPGELALAKDALNVVLKRHKVQAENREADRANAKGGRGRPRSKKAER